MPLYDAKTLEEIGDFALLSAVLYPTEQAKADAVRRGRERAARVGSFADVLGLRVGVTANRKMRSSIS